LKRDQLLYSKLVLFYEILMATVTVAVLLLVLLTMWDLVNGEQIEALLQGIGAVASSVAVKFLSDQRADARDAHAAIKQDLVDNNCLAAATAMSA
jgi:hypothetical protein